MEYHVVDAEVPMHYRGFVTSGDMGGQPIYQLLNMRIPASFDVI
jgi:hypothetical protein